MRVPVSHSIVLTAALCLAAAAPDHDQGGRAPAWGGASVSEKLRFIRESVRSHETAPANQRSVLAQNWRNCISGYWRNC
jgi:hypothetical protein